MAAPRAPFWMNYVEGGGAPTQRIEDREVAAERCQDLARTTGKRVYLLVTTDYVEPETPKPASVPVLWHHV